MALVPGATTLTLDASTALSVHAAWSDASRGDLRPAGPAPGDAVPLTRFADELAASTSTRIDRVARVTQVHGADVIVVEGAPDGPGGSTTVVHAGSADALVTAVPGTALCMLTADCAPLALSSPEGVVGAVHAGWRGLAAGVIEAAVDEMRSRGATRVTAALGPCIHAGCYEFSTSDLDRVAARYGDGVRATTTGGRPALDLAAGVAAAVGGSGAVLLDGVDECTACGGRNFSHRARGDTGRQAMLVWAAVPAAPIPATPPVGEGR